MEENKGPLTFSPVEYIHLHSSFLQALARWPDPEETSNETKEKKTKGVRRLTEFLTDSI